MNARICSPGDSYPLGATVMAQGVNFCLFSRHATGVELLLFDSEKDPLPSEVIPLDPEQNQTFFYWHIFVPGIEPGQIYGYRVQGPFDLARGLRFNHQKLLLDPYARAIAGWENYRRVQATGPGNNVAHALRSVVVDSAAYDWENDRQLCQPYATSVIYELHVGGFTRHPSSGVAPEKRGTFAGVIEKIPYLQSLGVTAVELLPVHQFDTQDVRRSLTNYWGYSTIAFFAPHWGYSSQKNPLAPVDEFRDMVKALHKAGIQVILDVVFNHTAEGDERGPTLSFRGLGNDDYYLLETDDPDKYANYSGCGNTFKANDAIAGRLILDSLRYWVSEMHVDGFRFDLASVLSRSASGEPMKNPPILWTIESDPILAGTKIIAEAWDAAGLYQVGSFIGDRFAEWNGPFRDDVRRFVKSDVGMVGALAARVLGSPDIFSKPDREPNRSINFITCHDGFTLKDLVSYNVKHNEANLEDSRDGANDNFSWNCGVEGPTSDEAINRLRSQQMKNLMTIMFVSQGTPMILMGDELLRTQRGNNNVYCHDDELSWLDWSARETEREFFRFVQGLIDFTQPLEIFGQHRMLHVGFHPEIPHLIWHGTQLNQPDWGEDSYSLAFSLGCPSHDEHLHVMLNAYWEPLTFDLPLPGTGKPWLRIVDTALPSPQDYQSLSAKNQAAGRHYEVSARSVVVLMAEQVQS
ncbi:MAG: glycogen debranching protein GlgX [Cyanobacteria bacterium P01_H01_bin.15]